MIAVLEVHADVLPELDANRAFFEGRLDAANLLRGPVGRCVLVPSTPTLLVSFGRSGNSPESVAAVNLASQLVKDCRHLVITCNAEGSLYRNTVGRDDSYAILLPEESHDRSFAMTSSFTGMLLAAALAFRAVSQAPSSNALLAQLAGAILPDALPRLRALADVDFQRIIYLGSQELTGLAHESALKMLELTDGKVVAVADSTLGFRHGRLAVWVRPVLAGRMDSVQAS